MSADKNCEQKKKKKDTGNELTNSISELKKCDFQDTQQYKLTAPEVICLAWLISVIVVFNCGPSSVMTRLDIFYMRATA